MTAALTLPASVTRDYRLHCRVCPTSLADDGALVVDSGDAFLVTIAAVHLSPMLGQVIYSVRLS